MGAILQDLAHPCCNLGHHASPGEAAGKAEQGSALAGTCTRSSLMHTHVVARLTMQATAAVWESASGAPVAQHVVVAEREV